MELASQSSGTRAATRAETLLEASRKGISSSQLRLIEALMDAPRGLLATELARVIGTTTGNIKVNVCRLRQKGIKIISEPLTAEDRAASRDRRKPYLRYCFETSPQPPKHEPIAVLRYATKQPGNENEMPTVISCSWLPDGEYHVFLASNVADEARRHA